MNADRRKEINAIIEALEKVAGFSDTISDIDRVKDDEQEYHDNMPESLQNGDKGSAAEEAIVNLEQASEKLQEVEDGLNEVIDFLRSVAGS